MADRVRVRVVALDPQVDTVFHYHTLDPWAVTITFRGGTMWPVARELMSEPNRGRQGNGDVEVWWSEGRMYLRLTPPGQDYTISFPADEVCEFLRMTYDSVPRGTEEQFVNWDQEISLLSGE